MTDDRTEEEKGAWAAFYDHAEYPPLEFNPDDWSCQEIMRGIRRVIVFLKREVRA